MKNGERQKFLDTRLARLIAALVFLIGLGAIVQLNQSYQARMSAQTPQNSAAPGVAAPAENLNPDYVKCHDERVGQVQKMFDEGVINQDKLGEFQQRAIDTCAGQFPPGG